MYRANVGVVMGYTFTSKEKGKPMPRIALKPGQHSASTNPIRPHPRGGWRIRWCARLYTGKLIHGETSSKNSSKTDLRRRAIGQAEQHIQLSIGSSDSQAWRLSSQISDYIREVVIPGLDTANLAPNSVARYKTGLTHLSEEFDGFTIGDALRPISIETALNHLAIVHGTASAKAAKGVLNRRVCVPLVKSGVLETNPCATGIEITVQHTAQHQPTGGESLDRDTYDKVITYLLTAETDGSEFSQFTRWRQMKLREHVINITLLQAVTGLRVGEARTLKKSDIEDTGENVLITINAKTSKTNRARTLPVLDPLVAERIRERIKSLKDDDLVFDAPARPGQEWERRNCQKALTKFITTELADAVDSDVLRTHSTHIWRSTLNTLAIDAGVSPEVRAAYFGHTEAVNKASYTGAVDVNPMMEILSK